MTSGCELGLPSTGSLETWVKAICRLILRGFSLESSTHAVRSIASEPSSLIKEQNAQGHCNTGHAAAWQFLCQGGSLCQSATMPPIWLRF